MQSHAHPVALCGRAASRSGSCLWPCLYSISGPPESRAYTVAAQEQSFAIVGSQEVTPGHRVEAQTLGHL